MMGAAVIPQGLFLHSLVSTIPTRRKYSYKVMGQFRERVPTPTYTNPYQENKDDYEYQKCDGGRKWFCSIKKRERGRGSSIPSLVVVACADMNDP